MGFSWICNYRLNVYILLQLPLKQNIPNISEGHIKEFVKVLESQPNELLAALRSNMDRLNNSKKAIFKQLEIVIAFHSAMDEIGRDLSQRLAILHAKTKYDHRIH